MAIASLETDSSCVVGPVGCINERLQIDLCDCQLGSLLLTAVPDSVESFKRDLTGWGTGGFF
jgi:hypothetical protein